MTKEQRLEKEKKVEEKTNNNIKIIEELRKKNGLSALKFGDEPKSRLMQKGGRRMLYRGKMNETTK